MTGIITIVTITTTSGLTVVSSVLAVDLILLLQHVVIPLSTLLTPLALLLTLTTRQITGGKILELVSGPESGTLWSILLAVLPNVRPIMVPFTTLAISLSVLISRILEFTSADRACATCEDVAPTSSGLISGIPRTNPFNTRVLFLAPPYVRTNTVTFVTTVITKH